MNHQAIKSRVTRRAGFTLIELLVVMVIISILLGFIFVASMDAARRAEERATQSLITKLDTALNDRYDALVQNIPDPNFAHGYLAAIYYGSGTIPQLVIPTNANPTLDANGNTIPNTMLTQSLRAQVIAATDYIKSELPDVFYVQDASGSANSYPLNFAGNPYNFGTAAGTSLSPWILPLGNSMYNNPVLASSYGDAPPSPSVVPNLAGTGIFGASYTAAAGIYKNLGYSPTGYDGVDNNNNGLVDEFSEGGSTMGKLAAHTHNTARAEMLYAILVEGRGPLGSVFTRDDFTDKEVQDTDGDGLPEFVDAWGQPLQFFRWPLLYHSDLQRGQVIQSAGATVDQSGSPPGTPFLPYKSVFEEREQDPLDVNQQLMAPGWWSSSSANGFVNSGGPYTGILPGALSSVSGGAQAFEFFFHRLTEPLSTANFTTGAAWDRGATYPQRRAFYSKFLILSGGLDQQPGVFLYADVDLAALANPALGLIVNENNAMPYSPSTVNNPSAVNFLTSEVITSCPVEAASSGDPTHPNNFDLFQMAQDDITNHNIQSTVGIGGSGP